jgi:hypothetical protein
MHERALIFCTGLIDTHLERYQGWASYYQQLFANACVDLLIVNDGPCQHSVPYTSIYSFPHRLGRLSFGRFPGWKRSFAMGLAIAYGAGYKRIAHIESDCVLTPTGVKKFSSALQLPGYKMGWCAYYNFPETAIQIINHSETIKFYIERWSNMETLFHEEDLAEHVAQTLCPEYILHGQRWEGKQQRPLQADYLAQCTVQRYKQLT